MNAYSNASLRELILSLAGIVRVQNGTQHDDINKLLQRAYEATQAYVYLSPAWTNEDYAKLPVATFEQTDEYFDAATKFVKVAASNLPGAAISIASIARYMAFEDGFRLR